MNLNFESLGRGLKGNLEKERPLERPLEKVSSSLWPWSEGKLARYVLLLAAMQTGGFLRLFVVDSAVVLTLVLLAVLVRTLYARLGFKGFGRAAFVFLLIPYFVVTLAVVYNNVLLSFL
jgi:hypothetical protein